MNDIRTKLLDGTATPEEQHEALKLIDDLISECSDCSDVIKSLEKSFTWSNARRSLVYCYEKLDGICDRAAEAEGE